ncbi:MAG: 2-amino-4-hydroxy-6-hydroxymethyldihydropteridine diphosphokinase [Acidobacteria bacterium 13_1_40CM_3_65_5]|nr:MAG: 2-amino-4-hydroxy-6-hydroxymethyldihydropteridine diphosphokinase [Acidobacteria bacterium 13_1_40CM_3_65_5]
MDRVAIALGSNVGDRRAHLDFAVDRLRTLLDNLKVSSYYETEPAGVPEPQPLFLNAAAVGETTLSARALLDALLAIERERGRERPYANAPRTLDLDLVLFGDVVIQEPDLVVPHPRFRERRFVLEPLAQIAPDLADPVTRLTIADLLRRARA